MLSVGLTGNLGSGKSTVARLLAERGVAIVDADALVHELLAPGGAAVSEVLDRFPEAAVEGRVDRRALGAIVFADAARRRELEAILHPLVVDLERRRVEGAIRSGADIVVTEATLLFEAADAGTAPAGSLARFDAIVAVVSDEARMIERAAARAGGGEGALDEARRRLAAQMPQDDKARRAHFVIANRGSLADLRREVDVLHSRLVERAARPRS